MRCGELYLDDVSECQGELFVCAVEHSVDLRDFVPYYLNHRIRNLIDRGYPKFCTMLGKEIFEELDVSSFDRTDGQDGFLAEWLGVFYSELQWASGIPSSEILTVAPLNSVIARYGALHDLDVKQAVKRWLSEYFNLVCFHNPDEENGYLSNWYLSAFECAGIRFSSMEQYMMYKKAELFGDTKTAAEILAEGDPAAIKALGRRVHGFNESVWTGQREAVVTGGLLEKFSQNAGLKEMLLATGMRELAECAVRDRIWGIGIGMSDPLRFDRKSWLGQNLLGRCLMRVRDRLRSDAKQGRVGQ